MKCFAQGMQNGVLHIYFILGGIFLEMVKDNQKTLIESGEKGVIICLTCKEQFMSVAGLRFHFISKHKEVLPSTYIQEQFYQGETNCNCKHCDYIDDKNKENNKKFHIIYSHYDKWSDLCRKGNYSIDSTFCP